MADPTTRPVSDDTKELLTGLANLGNSGSGGNSVAMPATQKYGLVKADEAKGAVSAPEAGPAVPGYVWVINPNYTPPKVTPVAPVGGTETGWYAPDPANPGSYKQVIPAHTPNADEEIKKYLDREQGEQLRTQRENNAAAGMGYADDDTVFKRSQEKAQLGINQADSVLKYKDLDERQRQFDITARRDDLKAAQDISQSQATVGQINANTGKIGADTAATTQTTQQNAALFPTTLEQGKATLAGTLQSTEASKQATATSKQAMQIAGAPQVQEPQKGMSQWTRNPLTGELTQGSINPEWQPKTIADVNARMGQIQSLARQKQQELLGKADSSGGSYTHDQAAADFNAWWNQNVEPQAGQLKAAQAQAVAEQQRLDQAQRANAMQTALGASTAATNAFTASQAGRVGPGIGQAMAQAAKGKFDFAPDAFSYTAPDINQTAQQSVMDALKFISPTAAAATGNQMPDYGTVDVTGGLNRTNYNFGAGAGAPPAVGGPGGGPPGPLDQQPMSDLSGGAPTAPTAPGAPNPYDYVALTQRRIADQQAQAAQRAAMQMPNYSFPG